MLSNAIVAGAIAATYVLILLLQLNPTLSLHPARLGPLALRVGLFYGLVFSAGAFFLLLVRRIFARGLFSPAWVSVTVLAWLGSITAGLGAIVMWANVQTFGIVLEAATITVLLEGAIILAAASLLLLIMALLQRYGGRRGVWASGVVIIMALSVALPVMLRGPAKPARPALRPADRLLDVPSSDWTGRVTVIALDAGSLELITNAAAAGRLPNFGRLLDSGAVNHLATLHPTSADAVWAAMATGKFPPKNGVRSAALYDLPRRTGSQAIELLPDYCFATGLLRFGLLEERPQTSASFRARPLWTILSGAGISTGVVNFPLTYPAPSVHGFIVSDAYARRFQPGDHAPLESVYPQEVEPIAASVARPSAGEAIETMLAQVNERHRMPARTDGMYEAIVTGMTAAHPVQVTVLRYQSLDPIGHYFLRYAMPARFGDVTDEDRRRYGGILEAHYGIVDDAIGRAIAELGPEDLLLVVSGFGIEPLGIGKRLLEQVIGDPELSGSHESAPDGFLLAYGASVARNRPPRRASIVDVLPTLLYFLGLPVGRDMDGYARTDLFLPSFTSERPITFIPTYDR